MIFIKMSKDIYHGATLHGVWLEDHYRGLSRHPEDLSGILDGAEVWA